jgi:hypothetical protein
MSKTAMKALDELPRQSRKPVLDCLERVSMYFDDELGCWCWIYVIEHFTRNQRPHLQTDRHGKTIELWGGVWNEVTRRLGELPLQNPKIAPPHLRRALMNDRYLGAFIPETVDWYKPGAGAEAGFEFKQSQSWERAKGIHERAEAYRQAQTQVAA